MSTQELSPEEWIERLPTGGWHRPVSRPSLPEVFHTIPVPRNATFWRRFLAFFAPGYLVAVGYMDPGNRATDISGGAVYNYSLLRESVLLAAGILGATVMPHVVFLQSALTQGRIVTAGPDQLRRLFGSAMTDVFIATGTAGFVGAIPAG